MILDTPKLFRIYTTRPIIIPNPHPPSNRIPKALASPTGKLTSDPNSREGPHYIL